MEVEHGSSAKLVAIFPHTTRQHLLNNNIILCIQEPAVCPSDSIVHTLKVWSSQGVMVLLCTH